MLDATDAVQFVLKEHQGSIPALITVTLMAFKLIKAVFAAVLYFL